MDELDILEFAPFWNPNAKIVYTRINIDEYDKISSAFEKIGFTITRADKMFINNEHVAWNVTMHIDLSEYTSKND